MNALIVYVCLIAGQPEFRDTPCVERPPAAAPAVGTIVEYPRYGVDRGGPPGSWPATAGSTVYRSHHRHHHGRR